MTLSEAVEAFESNFASISTGDPSATAETGERYVVITHAGFKPEGASVGWLATDEKAAVDGWLAAARAYAATAGGAHLYWRERPEVWVERRRTPIYGVYSRLLVSHIALVGSEQ